MSNYLIESAVRQLGRMTNSKVEVEDEIPEKILADNEHRTIDKSEHERDYNEEHHRHHMLFGANDYIPFGQTEYLQEAVQDHPKNPKRLVFTSDVPGKVRGVVVPRHMWEGTKGTSTRPGAIGMKERNKMRASVYGSDIRPPLSLSAMEKTHRDTLDSHFQLPHEEQIKAEQEAISRLQRAGHLDSGSTLDKGEKTDTVQNERDEQGRTHVGFSSKGVAGHALYTTGTGENETHHVVNTCPQQTKGCGGGVDAGGVADTLKGSCFAPRAEAQYVNASIRRATHEQAKFDPAMTRDWILSHTHSLRNESEKADKKNQRLLFRPNVLDETDRSSRHVLKHLNNVRASSGKPPIIANSYGKTDELNDPENNYHVAFSNTGPKVKMGGSILENRQKDKTRIRQTITATDAKGNDLVNEQGKKVPPKGSYLVTNMKRGGELDKKFQSTVTHAKYWSAPRTHAEMSSDERSEPPEAHYDGDGKPTTPDKAHYGHRTVVGEDGVARRYDYQKQHILHPRLVPVKVTTGGSTSTHQIPTDSRFKDDEFLPPEEKRFKTKNGKIAGHLMVTTPTTSTSDVQHHSNFTHHVSEQHIRHAEVHGGEYEIDRPEDQEGAKNASYLPPYDAQKAKNEKRREKQAVKVQAPPKESMAQIQARQASIAAERESSPAFKAKLASIRARKQET